MATTTTTTKVRPVFETQKQFLDALVRGVGQASTAAALPSVGFDIYLLMSAPVGSQFFSALKGSLGSVGTTGSPVGSSGGRSVLVPAGFVDGGGKSYERAYEYRIEGVDERDVTLVVPFAIHTECGYDPERDKVALSHLSEAWLRPLLSKRPPDVDKASYVSGDAYTLPFAREVIGIRDESTYVVNGIKWPFACVVLRFARSAKSMPEINSYLARVAEVLSPRADVPHVLGVVYSSM